MAVIQLEVSDRLITPCRVTGEGLGGYNGDESNAFLDLLIQTHLFFIPKGSSKC